jgi:uncharacterized protein YjbI with pentapeptide repeats
MSGKRKLSTVSTKVKKSFIDFLKWFRKAREIEVKRNAEENNRRIAKEAYFLWIADGKPEGKDDYYWKLARDKVEGTNVLFIFKPLYKLYSLLWFDPVNVWIKRHALMSILFQFAILIAVISFVLGEQMRRRNNEVFAAWQIITNAYKQSGSGGRIQALEFLNSRSLRFLWPYRTAKFWIWDEGQQKCGYKKLRGFRWKPESLAGLSAPNNAYLAGIRLCGVDLRNANLQDAILTNANFHKAILSNINLQNADLERTNLQDADLKEANLQSANLWYVNLQSADLTRANLQNATLRLAYLQNAELWSVKLQNANLEHTDLQNASLITANLQNTNLGQAKLQNARLIDSKLQNADLSNANLQNADLRTTNFKGAILKGANLQNADLRNAKSLRPKQIKLACFWDMAIYEGNPYRDKKAVELVNTKFIEALKKDKASDPEEFPNCNRW